MWFYLRLEKFNQWEYEVPDIILTMIFKYILFFFFEFIFSRRIIVLQCCVGFCHMTSWISHKFVCVYILTYIPFLLNLPPTPTSQYHHRAPGWAPCVTQQSFPLAIYFTQGHYSFNTTLSFQPTLSFPHCVHKSIRYICISMPALQMGSSVPLL